MTSTTLLILSIIVVASLTAAATAVRSVSRIWLRHWVERRLSGAETAELYLDRPQRLILAATTGVAIVVFVAGTIVASSSETVAAGARTMLIYALALLFLGQLLPRAIARRWASVVIPVLLPLLQIIEFVLLPILIVVRRVTGETRRDAFEGEPSDADTLEELLREGEMEGVGEHTEISIIEGVVQFGEKLLGAVMTPREDVFALDEKTPPAEMARLIAQSRYSRVPVYRDTLDNVVGMLHAFDVLQAEEGALRRIRPVAFATARVTCNDLLFRMLHELNHLAIVQDESGKTMGIVTLEDLLEELVGDIRDEHDEPNTNAPTSNAP